jgi:hypothetical protein
MAVKRIIVLTQSSNETEINYSGLFWIPVTSGIRTQTSGSSWVANGSSVGASTAENTAIQNGTISEVGWNFSFPVGTPVATIEVFLQQAWANKDVQINGIGPNQFYGSWWDGTSWASS